MTITSRSSKPKQKMADSQAGSRTWGTFLNSGLSPCLSLRSRIGHFLAWFAGTTAETKQFENPERCNDALNCSKAFLHVWSVFDRNSNEWPPKWLEQLLETSSVQGQSPQNIYVWYWPNMFACLFGQQNGLADVQCEFFSLNSGLIFWCEVWAENFLRMNVGGGSNSCSRGAASPLPLVLPLLLLLLVPVLLLPLLSHQNYYQYYHHLGHVSALFTAQLT